MPHAPITRRFLAFLLCTLLLMAIAPCHSHAQGPGDALDLASERKRLFERCSRARESCSRQNCDLHNGYSGCAVDCVGCFDMTISYALNEERWSLHPSYGACVVPLIEGYISQVESIQADYVSRSIDYGQQSESERAVRDIVSEGLKACEQSACQAKCADLGTTGGFQGWDCVCNPLPPGTSSGADSSQGSPEDALDTASPDAPATTSGEQDASAEQVSGGDEHPGQATGSDAAPMTDGAPAEVEHADSQADSQPSSGTGREWWEDVDDAEGQTESAPTNVEPRRVHAFRIRPIDSFSAGIVVGHVQVTYEIQELLDDGTTGRRCTVRFTGQGLTLGWPGGASFAPGYQWSEMQVPGGWSMSLEELDGVSGWHSSVGSLVGGGSAMHFGGKGGVFDKRLESRGLSWSVGPYMGADWMWGTWKIIEGPVGD